MPERAPDGTRPSQPEVPQKVGLAEAYAALESLLRASPRGRWFLAEFARRNRAAETDMLLEAIGRIERACQALAPACRAEQRLRRAGRDSEAIARTDAKLPRSSRRTSSTTARQRHGWSAHR
jgi:hypothetical protein